MSTPPQYGLGTVMPTPPRKRRTGLIVAVVLVAVLAAAGLTAAAFLLVGSERGGPAAAAATSVAAGQAVDQATVVECTNVARAYTAWLQTQQTATVGEVEALSAFHLQGLMEDGDQLLSQVKGYTDQPSKALAAAVAEYNLALAVANTDAVIGDGVTGEHADKVVAGSVAIQSSYSAFRSTTCSAVS